MTVTLSDKECAIIYKALEATDFSYIGESVAASRVMSKVLPGAIQHTKDHEQAVGANADEA